VKRRKMKKILLGVMLIVAMAAIGVSLTTALFSDTETSEGNLFTAGTLEISAGTASWTGTIDETNMKPCDTVTLTLTIENVGSLPLDYEVTAEITGDIMLSGTNDPTATVTPESGSLDPGETADIEVEVELPCDAGNEYQGLSGTLTVTVNAEQQ
jgi:predicted ribosomally synthesized peptide with SipW-like signal peptide